MVSDGVCVDVSMHVDLRHVLRGQSAECPCANHAWIRALCCMHSVDSTACILWIVTAGVVHHDDSAD